MKLRTRLLLLFLPIPAIQGQWVYVHEVPWMYDLATEHWMYVLPFYQFEGTGQSERIFDPEVPEFSHRWIYTGALPWLYDFTAEKWTWLSSWPLRWACELIPAGEEGFHFNWISLFDPLGKELVPGLLDVEVVLSFGYFWVAPPPGSTRWLQNLKIQLRSGEAEGGTALQAVLNPDDIPPWFTDFQWEEETPAVYEKLNASKALLSLPEIGIRIEMEFEKYRSGPYSVYGPDNQLLVHMQGHEVFHLACP